MRGKAASESDEDLFDGITPAYAGKSCSNIYRIVGIPGSPPPMRGKVNGIALACVIAGITPAYAGKSPKGYAKAADQQGSPPPMRGKDDIRETSVPFDRITPAYAGKSILFTIGGELYGDHPRLCGEKFLIVQKNSPIQGSPPPMRGKGEIVKTMVGDTGITPAYAGKSFQFTHFLFPPWDHPRLCGEKHGTFI